MENQKYLDDLRDIKDIMQRSSRFISLSGISGIIVGIFALIAAYFAYETVYADQDYMGYRIALLTTESLSSLLIIALLTLLLSIGTAVLFTVNKARKNNHSIWDMQTKRLLINLFIPLVAGGILCLILLFHGYVALVAPLTLIFYGLALINASKYTLTELRSLGIVEIILGLLAAQFIGYGLLFWVIGFGLLHIIYGIIMHIRHGS